MKQLSLLIVVFGLCVFFSCSPETPQRNHNWVYTNWQQAKNTTQPSMRCLEPGGNECAVGSEHPLPSGTSPGQWRNSADSIFSILKFYEFNGNLLGFFSDSTQWKTLVPPSVIGYENIALVQTGKVKVGIATDSTLYFYKGNDAFIRDSIIFIWKWND